MHTINIIDIHLCIYIYIYTAAASGGARANAARLSCRSVSDADGAWATGCFNQVTSAISLLGPRVGERHNMIYYKMLYSTRLYHNLIIYSHILHYTML